MKAIPKDGFFVVPQSSHPNLLIAPSRMGEPRRIASEIHPPATKSTCRMAGAPKYYLLAVSLFNAEKIARTEALVMFELMPTP